MRPGARHLGWFSAFIGALLTVAALMPLLPSAASGSTEHRCTRFARDSAARERIVTGHGATTVVIGDSYAAGLGLGHPGRSWASDVPGRVHVFGFSGSGFSTGASPCSAVSYAQRAPRALTLHPSLVVIEGGLNDFDQPSGDIRAGFRRLLTEVGHHPRVLVVGPPPAPLRGDRAARVDAILRTEAARSGTPYLSMIDEHFRYRSDRLHLTPGGHRAFGRVVADRLALGAQAR